MADYAIRKTVDAGFDEVLKRVPAVLAEEGFGVLTEIDVQATLKKKLDLTFRRYRILGACNPTYAHRALTTEIDIGAMLPCSVAVYEGDDGRTHVSAVNPGKTMEMLGRPQLAELGREVAGKLARALERL